MNALARLRGLGMRAHTPRQDWPAGASGSHAGSSGSRFGRREDFLDRAFDRVGPGVVRGPVRLFWWGVWLVFLVNPVAAILAGREPAPAAAFASISLLVFAALYLATGWVAFGVDADARGGQVLLPYLALLVITVPVAFALGGTWSEIFIYLGVATGATLEITPAIAILALLVVLDFAGAVAGRWQLSDVWFGAFMAVVLGLTMISFRRVVRLVVELRVARAELARLAVAEERLRFARDLHDGLGHSLSVIALKGQVARRLMTVDPPAAEAALGDLEAVAHESLGSLREMVSGYRQRSLSEELTSAEEVLRAAGIETEMNMAARVSGEADDLLAWVVREGVTNVLRHSRARRCRIDLAADDGRIRLELTDDGVGGAPSRGGSGLTGLRERLAAAGGSLEAGPESGGGYRLTAILPRRSAT